jgi:hypothetical protein
MRPRPPRFPGRSTRQVARMFAATPGLNPCCCRDRRGPRRSLEIAPWPPGPGPRRREAGAPGMLAARLPGNSTYDNPRYGQIRGCRGLPHSLTLFTGRPVRWPLLGRPGPVYPRTPGETPVARGAGRLPGVPYGGQPPVGPDPADRGSALSRSRTSPGIKATPLTLLLDRIVRDDEAVPRRRCVSSAVPTARLHGGERQGVLAERLAGSAGSSSRLYWG